MIKFCTSIKNNFYLLGQCWWDSSKRVCSQCTSSPFRSLHAFPSLYLFHFLKPSCSRGCILPLFVFSLALFFSCSCCQRVLLVPSQKAGPLLWDIQSPQKKLSFYASNSPVSFLDHTLISCLLWSGGEEGPRTDRAMDYEKEKHL